MRNEILWSAQVATIGIAAVQGILVARILGPSGLGAAALIVAFAGVMYSIVDARSSDASMKYLGGYIAHAKYKEALAVARLTYAVDLGVSVGALALVALTSSWASHHLVGGSEPAALFVVMGFGYAARFPVATSQSILLTMGRFVLVGRLQVGVALARAVHDDAGRCPAPGSGVGVRHGAGVRARRGVVRSGRHARDA